MKRKAIWYLGGALIVGLGALSVSCALIEREPPPLPVATIAPPAIPHSIEGRADCRLCHEKGLGGAPRFPADHTKRPSDVCRTCHGEASPSSRIPPHPGETMPTPPAEKMPTAAVEKTPAAISGSGLYAARCAACHGANRQGVPGLAPSLTPQSLTAKDDSDIRDAIENGRLGTAMPPFKDLLTPEETDALIQFIKSPAP